MTTNRAGPRIQAATSPGTVGKPTVKTMEYAVLQPGVNAAVVITEYTKTFGTLDTVALIDSLAAETEDLWAGDRKRAEAMLFAQAHALQAIFMSLAVRAARQRQPKLWEAELRMALKAQNQSRMTLETLATIKNPPVVIARQANISHGHQQVNNGPVNDAAAARADSQAASSSVDKSGLLEESVNGKWMDSRPAGATSCADSDLEAVGAVHRAAHE